jgi:hypothetical protein
MSDSETTTDLSDKNCTGEELDFDNLNNLPKVVSQSTGVGGIKRPVNSVDQLDLKRAKKRISNICYVFSHIQLVVLLQQQQQPLI